MSQQRLSGDLLAGKWTTVASPSIRNQQNQEIWSHKPVLIPICFMRLGKSFIPLSVNFFLISKNGNNSSYQAPQSTKRNNRTRGSQELSNCKGIMGMELRGDLTSGKGRRCHHPIDSKTRTTDLLSTPQTSGKGHPRATG